MMKEIGNENIIATQCIVVLISVLLFVAIIATQCANANSRVDEGTIVNKQIYHEDASTTTIVSKSRYFFTIQDYTFEVTEEDYNTYRIGDYYKR